MRSDRLRRSRAAVPYQYLYPKMPVDPMRDLAPLMGADVVGSTPEQFGAFMRAESEKWGRVIREANIRAE